LFPLTVACRAPTLAPMTSQQSRFHLSYHTRLRLMLLPYALGALSLVLVPALVSFGLAFFRYDGLRPPVWAGALNFTLAWTDDLFLLSVQNTLALIVLPVPLRVAGAFLLARLLLRGGRFLPWLRAAIYVPTAVPVAAYALGWLWIFNPLYGPLAWLLRSLGLLSPGWFADPLWARPAVAFISLWTLGEGFLVMLAALHDIPPALEDAARVDGAGSWAFLRYVTLPLLAPVLLLLALRDAILILQESFTTVLLTTGGGPYYATYTLPLFVYEQAYDLLNFGVASAALWFLYLLTGLIVIAVLLVAWQWRVGLDDEALLL
jgi:multiple sugar transport system permease protein